MFGQLRVVLSVADPGSIIDLYLFAGDYRCYHVSVAAQAIRAKADDPAFQEQWRQMKQAAKVRALARISEATGVQLPENAMLDVQVRRPSPNPAATKRRETAI